LIGVSAPIYQVGAAAASSTDAGEERYRRSANGQSVRVFILATARTVSLAQAPSNAVPVTANNFNRAATDMYFASDIKQAGAIGKLHHHREAMPTDNQTVVRTNRDSSIRPPCSISTPVPSVILPDPGKRFIPMLVLDQDQYA
jgi:hypothetical protein